MTEIVTVDLPEAFYKVQGGSFRLMPMQSIFQSMFNAGGYRFEGARGMRWVGQIDLVIQKRETWQKFDSFIARVADRPYAFNIYHPSKKLPLGIGGGIDFSGDPEEFEDPDTSLHGFDGGLYDGASFCSVKEDAPRYANSFVVEGLPVSSTILKDGDHFSVGGNLYMATGDILSDANGDARLDFVWRLHKPVVAGDLVDFRNPPGRFIIQDQESAQVALRAVELGEASFSVVEFPFV